VSTDYSSVPRILGESRPFFHWSGKIKEPVVVHHPSIPFDPMPFSLGQQELLSRPIEFDLSTKDAEPHLPRDWNRTPIFYESFSLSGDFFEAISGFTSHSERFSRLEDDEILWYDTGYWAAQRGRDHYIGIGAAHAEELVRSVSTGVLCYVLCHPGAMLAFTLGDITRPERFSLDMYLNNTFSPFAEERRNMYQTLGAIGSWESVESVLGFEKELMRSPIPKKWLSRENTWNEVISLKPLAVVNAKKKTFYLAAVTRNLWQSPWKSLNRTSYLLVTYRHGYWVDDDFLPPERYGLFSSAPYFLRTCTVLNTVLDHADWIRSSFER